MKFDMKFDIKSESTASAGKLLMQKCALLKRYLYICILLGVCTGCTTKRQTAENKSIYVSIQPLKGLVEQIVGGDFPVEVLVPAGASPETFEPSARQLAQLNDAQLVLGVGLLDFEKTLLEKLEVGRPIIHLAEGIDLIAGSCSHCAHGHHHAHGVDPHVWTSPRELQTLAQNAHRAILELYPDSVKYTTNYQKLNDELKALDKEVGEQLAAAGVTRFLIYHPAMSYYARAYGIEQVAIEHEGKEPSAKRITSLIESGRRYGTKYIFYQSQFPATSVEVIAQDLQAEPVAVNPLTEEITAEIRRFTTLLCDN